MTFELEHLRVFRAVASEKSFTKAAEKLYRTQPGVSQIIRHLEDALGETLFERRGRISTLTQAGQILMEHTGIVFDILEQARIRIQSLRMLQEGRLTISTSDTTAYYLLPQVLKKYRNTYPGVELRIQSKPSPISVEQVVAREVDMGIVTLPVDHPGLVTETVMIREDVAICDPDHELAQSGSVTFEQLAGYPLVLLDHGSNTRTYIDQRFLLAGVVPNIIMEIGSIEVIKRLVQLNFGVSIVPLISVQEDVCQKALMAMRIFKKDECRRLGIIYPNNNLLTLAARVFIEMLKAHLGKISR